MRGCVPGLDQDPPLLACAGQAEAPGQLAAVEGEGQVAAIAILLAGPAGKPARGNRGLVQVTGPAGTAALIDRLRADGTVLTYDPGDRTLRAGDTPSVTIGRDATGVRPHRNKERRAV